jgi:signal transduction histidine kinase
VFDLAPPELEEGLAAGVEVVAATTFAGSGTNVELDLALEVEPDGDTAMTVYRIVAEALVNARRHAEASNVRVELASDQRWLTGSVADDGRGAAELVTPPGHLGLRTMRERAEVLGGVAAVRSTPGEGTVVSFRVPVRTDGG